MLSDRFSIANTGRSDILKMKVTRKRQRQYRPSFTIDCACDGETRTRMLRKFQSIKAASHPGTNAQMLERVFDVFLSGTNSEAYSLLVDNADNSGSSLLVCVICYRPVSMIECLID